MMSHFTRKTSNKDFRFGVNLHSLISHFLFSIFFFRILSKPQINYQSRFFTIFIIRESIKKRDWKLGVVSWIKTEYRNYLYFHWEQNTYKINQLRQNPATTYNPFILFRFPDPVVERRNILIEDMVIRTT